MAKFELRFLDSSNNESYISTYSYIDNDTNEIYIEITNKKTTEKSIIFLDKSTAIKFAKTLRTEINKITESEGGQDGTR